MCKIGTINDRINGITVEVYNDLIITVTPMGVSPEVAEIERLAVDLRKNDWQKLESVFGKVAMDMVNVLIRTHGLEL